MWIIVGPTELFSQVIITHVLSVSVEITDKNADKNNKDPDQPKHSKQVGPNPGGSPETVDSKEKSKHENGGKNTSNGGKHSGETKNHGKSGSEGTSKAYTESTGLTFITPTPHESSGTPKPDTHGSHKSNGTPKPDGHDSHESNGTPKPDPGGPNGTPEPNNKNDNCTNDFASTPQSDLCPSLKAFIVELDLGGQQSIYFTDSVESNWLLESILNAYVPYAPWADTVWDSRTLCLHNKQILSLNTGAPVPPLPFLRP